MAAQVIEVFTEVVIAPDFDAEALAILRGKKNIRLLRCAPPPHGSFGQFEWRPVSGGLLLQSVDHIDAPGDDPARLGAEGGRGGGRGDARRPRVRLAGVPRGEVERDPAGSGGASVGVGMGQVNRVDSARLAVTRAGDRAAGSVAASDAFFPFPDGFEILAEAGVRAVAEPGGSVRDDTVIAAAEAAGVTLYFTGVRHFYH